MYKILSMLYIGIGINCWRNIECQNIKEIVNDYVENQINQYDDAYDDAYEKALKALDNTNNKEEIDLVHALFCYKKPLHFLEISLLKIITEEEKLDQIDYKIIKFTIEENNANYSIDLMNKGTRQKKKHTNQYTIYLDKAIENINLKLSITKNTKARVDILNKIHAHAIDWVAIKQVKKSKITKQTEEVKQKEIRKNERLKIDELITTIKEQIYDNQIQIVKKTNLIEDSDSLEMALKKVTKMKEINDEDYKLITRIYNNDVSIFENVPNNDVSKFDFLLNKEGNIRRQEDNFEILNYLYRHISLLIKRKKLNLVVNNEKFLNKIKRMLKFLL